MKIVDSYMKYDCEINYKYILYYRFKLHLSQLFKLDYVNVKSI